MAVRRAQLGDAGRCRPAALCCGARLKGRRGERTPEIYRRRGRVRALRTRYRGAEGGRPDQQRWRRRRRVGKVGVRRQQSARQRHGEDRSRAVAPAQRAREPATVERPALLLCALRGACRHRRRPRQRHRPDRRGADALRRVSSASCGAKSWTNACARCALNQTISWERVIAIWSVSGEKRTAREHPKSVANDPWHHFDIANWCIATCSFDHLVGSGK